MKTEMKISFMLILTGFLLIAGCAETEKTTAKIKETISPKNQQPAELPNQKRFQAGQDQGQSVVESAMVLSQKYADLSNEMSVLKDKHAKLLEEHQKMQQDYEKTKNELARTNKELKEANDLLIDMRLELNNWKADVLGFRDEMRDANRAQLEALFKVLKILGAEMPDSPQDANDNN